MSLREHIEGIRQRFDSPDGRISMRDVIADLGLNPSPFQAAILCKWAGENLSLPEAAAWTMATNNRPMPEDPFEWTLCVGRQGGKSQVIAPAVVVHSIENAKALGVSAGRPAAIVVVAPVTRQGKITLRAIERALESHPRLSGLISEKRMANDDAEIVFGSLGVTVKIVPSNPRTARGNAIILVLGDEVDFFLADDQGNANWNDLYEAVRPGLVSFMPGARVLKISSPAGTNGPMHADKLRAEAGDKDLVFFHASTEQMNPLANAAFIERERAKNPSYASREYDALFLDSAGTWLSKEQITAAQAIEADAPLEDLYAQLCASVEAEGGTVSTPVVAFDLANKGKDRATYAIACRVDFEPEKENEPVRPHGVVLRVRAFERQPGVSLLDPRPCVLEGLGEALKVGVRVAVCDQVMTGYVFGEARDRGIELKHKFTGTESHKAHDMFGNVGPLFKEERAMIPEDEALARELGGLEDKFTRMKSNTAHDDRATATVAALDEAVFQQPRLHKPWFAVL